MTEGIKQNDPTFRSATKRGKAAALQPRRRGETGRVEGETRKTGKDNTLESA